MTRKVTDVRSIAAFPDGSAKDWCVDFLREDGLSWCRVFPAAALWGRSAEYGIDPAAVDTLLDIVLHECVMDDYGFAAGHGDPDFVYHTDPATALSAHLARLKRAKATAAFVDPEGKLDQIRRHHLSAESEANHRDFYRDHRAAVSGIRKHRGVITGG